MLLVKLIEATIRIFGGVGFHESRHVVDSGLLGVLGLVGCCSTRRPQRRSRYRNEPPQPATLPLSRPAAPFKDVTPTPSAPPSVLRPEHALQPYKEESDDETGFIMGAWQPFPRPGYNAVEEQPPVPEPPKAGFARVGGGRAHYESPYAITSTSGSRGSTQTFPSVEQRSVGPSNLNPAVAPFDHSPPVTPSISSTAVARHADVSLPPGAMPPAHVRTKSQSAIVEDASALLGLEELRAMQGDPPAVFAEEEDVQPKKKWFGLRRNRRPSELDPQDLVSPDPPAEQEGGSRSFVVVRKGRPGAAGASSSTPDAEPRSFAVLRGNNANS